MTYDLNELLGWARRSGGDRVLRQRDTLVTDGTDQVTLNNDGSIAVTGVSLAGTPVASGNYTLDQNVIVFNTTPPDGATVIVNYTQSVYTDAEILQFLCDAATSVDGDLVLKFVIDRTASTLTDGTDQVITAANKMNAMIEKLIAVKAGIAIREDIANAAAGDAIKIKDGDTSIDTAATAAGNETALKRMQENYKEALRIAIANRTSGAALDQNNCVL